MRPIRLISFLLALLLCLTACDFPTHQETVTFYYPRDPQRRNIAPTATFYAAEEREASISTSLRYLLSLYLQGPLDDTTVSPFPTDTRLVDLDLHAGQLYIQLSQEFGQLNSIDLTIACTCLSLTCFDLAQVDRVTIITSATEDHPAVEITLSRQDLTLTDTVIQD